jgi:hypothetical protein
MSQTPLPWHVCHQNRIHDAAHRFIAETAMDDAAFIIQACNAHHALVEALTHLSDMADNVYLMDYQDWADSVQQSRAALALAQKE